MCEESGFHKAMKKRDEIHQILDNEIMELPVTRISYADMTWGQILALEDEHSPTMGVPTGLLERREFQIGEKLTNLERQHAALKHSHGKVLGRIVFHRKKLSPKKSKAFSHRARWASKPSPEP
jgi:hypothetical protein